MPWEASLLEEFAEAKYLSFRTEIDSNVFPCLGELGGCRRLMSEIARKPGFLPQATWLAVACVATVVSVWIEKGLGMVVAGFNPSPLGHVTRYVPSLPEVLIGLGVYGIGALVVTILYKTALSVRGEVV